MTEPVSLFDHPAGDEVPVSEWPGGVARDAALDQVEEHANPEWLATAEAYVRRLPSGLCFTTDDVWDHLGELATHEPRALGAVMMRLAKARVVAKTGNYRPTTRKQAHARPIPVWMRQ